MPKEPSLIMRLVIQAVVRIIYFAGTVVACFGSIVAYAPRALVYGGDEPVSLALLFSLGMGLLSAAIGPQLYRYYAHRGRGKLRQVRAASQPPAWAREYPEAQTPDDSGEAADARRHGDYE